MYEEEFVFIERIKSKNIVFIQGVDVCRKKNLLKLIVV